MNDLFLHDSLDTSPIVSSKRVLYTPTPFAKSALLYLQEIGSLQAAQPHTSYLLTVSNRTPIVPIKICGLCHGFTFPV